MDEVNHPCHYNTGKIEVIDFILDQNLSFLTGNVVKYICRAPHKGDELTDLKKARFYLTRAIVDLEDQIELEISCKKKGKHAKGKGRGRG